VPLARGDSCPADYRVQRAITPEIRHPYGTISQVDAGYSARRAGSPDTARDVPVRLRLIGIGKVHASWGLELPKVREVSRWWARNE
jgi:hypothetical protein